MNKLFSVLILLIWGMYANAQQIVVDHKGTKTPVDSSKWRLSGANIIAKNTGNVGIGNPSPTYKLDVTGKVRISDSLVVNTKSKFSDSLFVSTSLVTNHLVSSGAVFGKVVRTTSTTGYSIGATDYIVHLSSGYSGTITLPAIATSIGRILFISNHSGAARTTSLSYRISSTATTSSIPNNGEVSLVSDGTEWFTLGQ